MRFKIKPIVAGAAAGAALAVGGIAAIDLSSEPAEAQSGSLSEIRQQQRIIQRQNIRAIKQVNTYSQFMKYLLEPGQIVGVQSSAPNQARGEGGGWQAAQMSEGVTSNWPYWVRAYYDGSNTHWTGRGVTSVTRTGEGEFQVNWSRDISGCSYLATPSYFGNANPQPRAIAQVYQGVNNQQAIVRTSRVGNNNVTSQDYPFHGQVVCSPQTGSS